MKKKNKKSAMQVDIEKRLSPNRELYKEAWRQDRKNQVDQFVLDQVAIKIPMNCLHAIKTKLDALEFKKCDSLPSETHVKIAKAAKKRIQKQVDKMLFKFTMIIGVKNETR